MHTQKPTIRPRAPFRYAILALAVLRCFIALALADWSAPPPAYPFRFILDIDNVIAYSIPKGEAHRHDLTGKVTVEYGKFLYVVYDDAAELIQDLLDIPGSKVGFFSFGTIQRNQPLLEKLILPRGRDGKRAAKDIAFTVLSWDKASWARKEDYDKLARLNPDHPFFYSMKKKNLLNAVSSQELLNTILIDDTAKNVYRGQEGSFLLVEERWKSKAGHIRHVLENLFAEMKKTGKPPAELLFDLQFEKLESQILYRDEGTSLYDRCGDYLR